VKESNPLTAMSVIAKSGYGMEGAVWGRGAKAEERAPRGFRGQLAAFTSGTERAKIRPEKEKLARPMSEAQPC
jgi:hypothetical protein